LKGLRNEAKKEKKKGIKSSKIRMVSCSGGKGIIVTGEKKPD